MRARAIALAWSTVVIVVVAVAASRLLAQAGPDAAPRYQTPPQVIVDILDAPPTPGVVVSPTREVMALLPRRSMPAITELSRPMLRLAGLRINPANNGPHQAPLGSAVQIGEGLLCVVDDDAINLLTPFTSMFLHGGWMHLLGNGLFLWVFGNNVEDSMGRFRFVIFYLLCGLAAAAAQVFQSPASPVPMIGASGAISGVLGAYLVLYPRVPVNVLIPIFIFILLAVNAAISAANPAPCAWHKRSCYTG